jgi:hypothetical protein
MRCGSSSTSIRRARASTVQLLLHAEADIEEMMLATLKESIRVPAQIICVLDAPVAGPRSLPACVVPF